MSCTLVEVGGIGGKAETACGGSYARVCGEERVGITYCTHHDGSHGARPKPRQRVKVLRGLDPIGADAEVDLAGRQGSGEPGQRPPWVTSEH